jgi:hypothetical protein
MRLALWPLTAGKGFGNECSCAPVWADRPASNAG